MPTKNEQATGAEGASAAAAPAEPQTAKLAEENRRLTAENRRLRQAELQRDVDCFLEGLRQRGQLTPAMEQAGVEQALILSEEQVFAIEMPDGRQLSLGAVLREVLSALPVCCPTASALASPATGNGRACWSLSEEEREIARQLGLSEEEFREIEHSA